MAKEKVLGEVHLKDVRLSFPHVFEPQPGRVDPRTGAKGEDRYNSTFLIRKDDESNISKVKAAAAEVKKAKWGDNQPKLKADRICFRDGDLEDYDGYAGHFYVSAGRPAASGPPALVDRDPKEALTSKASGKLYGGCYVNAIVRIWAQDSKEYGKRLNASLEAVQFLRHGDAFGAKPVNPQEAFEDVSEQEGSDIGDDDDSDDLL